MVDQLDCEVPEVDSVFIGEQQRCRSMSVCLAVHEVIGNQCSS